MKSPRIIFLIIMLLFSRHVQAEENSVPELGAIRWDAWVGDQREKGEKFGVGKAVEASLGPEKWHYRLPFFAKVLGTNQVSIDGTSQEIMDREIEYAANARLSYWAFVAYSENSSLSICLKNYLSSQLRAKIKFCLIVEGMHWEPDETDRLERLMTEKGYLTVLDGRPVIYLFTDSRESVITRAKIDDFRAGCQAKKLKNPYIVIMDFDARDGKKCLDRFGADALSSYKTIENKDGKPIWKYADTARSAEGFWDQCKATGKQVVPIISLSAGRAPRIEHPVPWEKWQRPGVGNLNDAPPTPEEIKEIFIKAIKWLRTNRESAQAQIAIIYAWNENDEGGWLVPTLSEGMARLDAVEAAIKLQSEK